MTTGRSLLLLLLLARTSAPLLPPVAGGGTADRIGNQVIHDPGRRLLPGCRMDTVKEVLLRELKKLKAEEFNDFKFHLEEYGSKVRSVQGEDRAVISPCDLENADRRRAVDLIVQTYSPEPLQVAKDVLEKVGRHDLIESLDRSSSRNTGPMQLSDAHHNLR